MYSNLKNYCSIDFHQNIKITLVSIYTLCNGLDNEKTLVEGFYGKKRESTEGGERLEWMKCGKWVLCRFTEEVYIHGEKDIRGHLYFGNLN